MIVFTSARPDPFFELHDTGDKVVCRALTDRSLVDLVCSASDLAIATRPGRPLPKAAAELIDTLHGYGSGYRRPIYREEEAEEFDPALRRAALSLEASGHMVLAGTAHRTGAAGREEVALVFLLDQSATSCVVRIDLDAVQEGDQ